MTARRSSATERRGTALSWRRPTAMLLAFSTATAVVAGAAGCASRQGSTGQLVGKTLPENQDTAAAQQQLAAPPTTPPGQATPYGHLSPPGNPKNNGHPAPAQPPPTPPTPTTNPAWTTDPLARDGMAADLLGQPPQFMMTPEANPAAPGRARLEIITMPMWLWVDTPSEQTTVINTGSTVLDWIVIDKVVWSIPGAPNPSFVCDGTGVANQGPGIPFASSMDPANKAAPVLPEPCITSFASPYYSTAPDGTTVDGVYQLGGVVTWHVAWQITTSAGVVTNGTTGGPVVSAIAGPAVPFRVGEIQALATSP